MNEKANKELTSISKILRKQMTKEERHLWYDFLKDLPVTINRQKVIGKYVVDFYCASAKIVIELDGFQHYEEDAYQKDKERDGYLNSLGIKVLRYSNYDLNRRFEEVCADILKHIDTSSVSQN
ncbi:MAG: endonuclease domain-containing protein [Clostridia bacterium]|nr:endonuclease domain-containing protein [Clostridia bacterium]